MCCVAFEESEHGDYLACLVVSDNGAKMALRCLVGRQKQPCIPS